MKDLQDQNQISEADMTLLSDSIQQLPQVGLAYFDTVNIANELHAKFPLDFFSVGQTKDGPRAFVMYTENSAIQIPHDADEIDAKMIKFSAAINWDKDETEVGFEDRISAFLEVLQSKIIRSQLRLLMVAGTKNDECRLLTLDEVNHEIISLKIRNNANGFTHLLVDSKASEGFVQNIQNEVEHHPETPPNGTRKSVSVKEIMADGVAQLEEPEDPKPALIVSRIEGLTDYMREIHNVQNPFMLVDMDHRDSMISVVKDTGEVYEDPMLERAGKVGFFGWIEVSLMALSDRRVIAGHMGNS